MKPTIIDIKDWTLVERQWVTLTVRSGRDADVPWVELLAGDERVAFMSGPESGALVEALIQHGAASAHGGAARCTEPDCVLCTLTAQIEQERARADELEDRLQRVLSGGVHPAGCTAYACAPECKVTERPAWLVDLRTTVSLVKRERDALQTEVSAVVDSIPGAVRVREGGADENLAASLAVSVARLLERCDTYRAEREGSRDQVEALGRKLAEEAKKRAAALADVARLRAQVAKAEECTDALEEQSEEYEHIIATARARERERVGDVLGRLHQEGKLGVSELRHVQEALAAESQPIEPTDRCAECDHHRVHHDATLPAGEQCGALADLNCADCDCAGFKESEP